DRNDVLRSADGGHRNRGARKALHRHRRVLELTGAPNGETAAPEGPPCRGSRTDRVRYAALLDRLRLATGLRSERRASSSATSSTSPRTRPMSFSVRSSSA